MNKMAIRNAAFSEKYRPQAFSEVIGINTTLLENFCKKPQEMPHLLLYSKAPGTGKTTVAKVIIKHLGAESLFMNASDERKIEHIREKVKRFVQCQSKNDVPRFVFLDECDGMIKGSQEALRSIMEQYPAKFIITCNNVEKIIDPVQSRCTKIHLGLPEKESIYTHLQSICDKESISYDKEAIKKLVDINYPSIRDMLNQLQLLSLENEKITESIIKKQEDVFKHVYDLLKDGKLEEARKEWIGKGLPIRDMLKCFFDFIWNDKYEFATLKMLVELLAEADYRMAVNADPDITMFWFAVKFRGIVK